MDQQQFERTVLQMVQQRRIDRLTPSAVAQAVGLNVKDAERCLDRMVTTGGLELDSDDDGNLFYFVPGLGTAGVFTQGMPSTYQTDAPGGPASGQAALGGYAQNPYGAPTGAPPGQPTQSYGASAGQAWNAPPPAGSHPYGAPPASYGQAPPSTGYGGQPGYGAPGGYPPGGGYSPGGPPGGAATRNPYGAPPQAPPYGQPPTYSQGYGAPAYTQQAPPSAYGQPGYSQPNYPPPGYGQPGYGQPGYGHNALVPVSQTPGRSPAAAAMLGFFPGAGQLYNGQVFKGMMFFCATMLTLSAGPLFLLPMMWGMADAYQTARRANQSRQYAMLPDHT